MRKVIVMTAMVWMTVGAAGGAWAEGKKPTPPAAATPTPVPVPADTQGERLVPKVVAIDTNKDGKPDRWEYYDNGVISRIESDTNGDGKIDEWVRFDHGKVVRVEKDTDYDGKPDRWVDY